MGGSLTAVLPPRLTSAACCAARCAGTPWCQVWSYGGSSVCSLHGEHFTRRDAPGFQSASKEPGVRSSGCSSHYEAPLFQTVLDIKEEIAIEKGKVVAKLPKLYEEWQMSFDFKPASERKTRWKNVIRVAEERSLVDHFLFELMYNRATVSVCVKHTQFTVEHCHELASPPAHTWITVSAAQYLWKEGTGLDCPSPLPPPFVSFCIVVRVNGKVVIDVENPHTNGEQYSNVEVLVSDSTHNPQLGWLTRLLIQTTGAFTFIFKFTFN